MAQTHYVSQEGLRLLDKREEPRESFAELFIIFGISYEKFKGKRRL